LVLGVRLKENASVFTFEMLLPSFYNRPIKLNYWVYIGTRSILLRTRIIFFPFPDPWASASSYLHLQPSGSLASRTSRIISEESITDRSSFI
jgi:hypothetical protein